MATANEPDPDENDGSIELERIGAGPIDGDGSYPFAGLTRYDDEVEAVGLPEEVWDDTSSMKHWAINKSTTDREELVSRDIDPSVLPEMGLNTLIPQLPRANHAQAAWIHPRTGEIYKTAKHNAVIDPERAEKAVGNPGTYAEAIAEETNRVVEEVELTLEEMSTEDYMDKYLTETQRAAVEARDIGDNALFQIAGGDHSIINPQQPLEELTKELQDRGLGDKVFGEVNIDRDGGRASLDVYMDGEHVESPVFDNDRNPVVVGLQIQWSFFDDWAFRVCGQGLDWDCVNHIHRLTNRETVKYSGDIESRVEWREMFSDILDSLDEKRDQLARIIKTASEEVLKFSNLPEDFGEKFDNDETNSAPWTALYAYMGLPEYLSERAGLRLRSQAEDAYRPTWWEIHSAATYAISHHDRGSRMTGGSFERHASIANDMLMNPASMESVVVENYEAARSDDEESELATEGGGSAHIRTAFESVREKKDRYEQWSEEMKEMGVDI